jgi:signal transduction histidine kinase
MVKRRVVAGNLYEDRDMGEKNGFSKEIKIRLQEINQVIQSIASRNFTAKAEVTSKADMIDALAVGVNMLAEELDASTVGLEYVDKRTEEILGVIQKTARGDFSETCRISEKNDSFDALAIGINMMIDDLRDRTKDVEEKQEKLNEKIEELEENELAALNIMEDLSDTTQELEKSKSVIEEKNTELENLNTLKSAFLNITSHELRTPMSSIKGYIQMLLKQKLGNVNEEQKSALEVILRNADRLDHLIQDILDVSRLESGTMKFIQENTVIRQMVEEVAETMQSSAALKDIKLNTEIGEDVPNLFIDKERITQVVVNLLNNAIKFSPDGSIINLKVKKEYDDVLFEVEDFGRGIPKDKQDKVFETFYQVDSGKDTKFGGAGLGLAISRGIVIAHGGKIWVESEGKPGKGSTFRFTLPVETIKDIEKRFKGVDIFRLEKEDSTYEEKNENSN